MRAAASRPTKRAIATIEDHSLPSNRSGRDTSQSQAFDRFKIGPVGIAGNLHAMRLSYPLCLLSEP